MPTAAKYQSAAPLATSKVDAEAGIIRDVALVSIGEALGHGVRIDEKSLSLFFGLAQESPFQSFIKHDDDHSPAEVTGLFSGTYIDSKSGVLRANWTALNAFREHNKAEFSTLIELAEKAPATFGLSMDFDRKNVWTMKDGSEVEAEPIYKKTGDGREYFAGWKDKPVGATDDELPVVRPYNLRSADFVQEPAANAALFSAQKTVDTTPDNGKASSVVETQSHLNKKSPISKMKQIYAKFSANPKALTRACQLAAEMPEDTKEEAIIDKVEEEIDAEAYASVIAENAALKAKVAEFEAKVAEQEPKVAEAAALSTKVTELTEQVAKLSKTRGRFGAAPINTGKDAGKEPVTITRAQFNALSHPERETHMKSGGKITD